MATTPAPPRLPDWARDELLLALDVYLKNPTKGWGKTAKEAIDLSAELRSLRVFPDSIRTHPTFRSPSSVALKLSNYATIDPVRPGGMPNVGSGDRAVWTVWAHRPADLADAVALIRSRGTGSDTAPDTGEEEEYGAMEGQVAYREHRRYERDRKLVKKKKDAVMTATGKLACEVCGFDSMAAYGIGGVIDVHHVVPLHKIGVSRTTLADLALVCPTCHRTIHKSQPFLTPAELQGKIAP